MNSTIRMSNIYKNLTNSLFFIILLFSFFLPHSLEAQKMNIAYFGIDETATTANIEPTMRYDINLDKCAIIKIQTTQRGFTFDVGMLGITHVEEQNSLHPAEIWLYVSKGTKKISIQHPQLGVINDYDLSCSLKPGKTYVMNLTSEEVNTITIDYNNSQTLDVDIEPYDADFYLNGVRQALDRNGKISLPLPFGTYQYRITANNYHPEVSTIIINDKDNRQNLSVRLKQAFGYLNVNSDYDSDGAIVYVDDTKVSALPLRNFPLKSGMHEVTIYKKLYQPYFEKIAMADSATVNISPIFEPNYAEYEIIVDGDKDAKIYDNGELLGTGRWKGILEAGEHVIEAKKISHYPVTERIGVIKDIPRKVSLSRPMPIYGTLEVKTYPSNAKVYLDDSNKPLGVTDLIDNHILIGPHRLRIELKGYKTEIAEIDIKEGQTERLNLSLTDVCDFTLSSKPVADISINGMYEGKTPLHFEEASGTYRVTLEAHGYSTKNLNLHLDGNTKDMTIKLQRNMTRKNEFYLQAGCGFIGMSALNFGMGFYAGNVNVEGNYLLGLSKSETIYWNDNSEGDYTAMAAYKPSGGNAKIGYGIRLHSRIRLTPQIGCQFISLKEKFENAETISSKYSDGIANKASAVSATGGLRINVAVAPCLGISITPQYLIGIYKSNGYKALSEISPKIKGFADGINLNVSVNLFF